MRVNVGNRVIRLVDKACATERENVPSDGDD